jgi:5-(carboxyamino)imidazole ribonucleotide mutase
MARSTTSAPAVGIIMGSQSDWETMSHAADTLRLLGVTFETEVVSAHRTPLKLKDYALAAKRRGLKVIVAGAGGAAHLPGMAAAMTVLPVLGVPVQSKAVGRAGAINAALGAAAILALGDAALARRLDAYRAKQTKAVLDNPVPGRKGKRR